MTENARCATASIPLSFEAIGDCRRGVLRTGAHQLDQNEGSEPASETHGIDVLWFCVYYVDERSDRLRNAVLDLVELNDAHGETLVKWLGGLTLGSLAASCS